MVSYWQYIKKDESHSVAFNCKMIELDRYFSESH